MLYPEIDIICIWKVFAKHGLVQENPLGEKFDPNKHDALFQVIYGLIFLKDILPRFLSLNSLSQ